MDSWDIKQNKIFTTECQMSIGYAPNPGCELCKGFGRIHPRDYDGKVLWNKTILCPAKGCMEESFHRRGL